MISLVGRILGRITRSLLLMGSIDTAMAFRFKLDETMQKGLQRISREQFAIALGELDSDAVMPLNVHQARKVLKRLRGLLRLIGPSLGRKVQRTRNASLRDIGRLLAGRRDSAVMVQTLDKLAADAATEDKALLEPLVSRFSAANHDLSGPLENEIRDEVRAQLFTEAKAFRKLKVKGKGFAVVDEGLKATYGRGRTALKAAYKKESDEAFHELRKMVQAHWRQMSILSMAWPEMLDVRVAAARELSQVLGDDHDLAALVAYVKSDAELEASVKQTVTRLAQGRQKQLRDGARYQLERLYAEPPGAFAARIGDYWRTARRLNAVAPKKPSRKACAFAEAAAATPADTPHVAAKELESSPSQRRR